MKLRHIRQLLTKHREDLIVAGLLLVFALAILFRSLFIPELSTYNIHDGPHYRAFEAIKRASILRGEWPLWNPYFEAGMPGLADTQMGVFYPFTLLLVWLPPIPMLNWASALHIWLAGLGMYFLLRDFEVRPVASMMAGIAFMCSGAYLSYVGAQPTGIYAFTWCGWLMLAARRLLITHRPGALVALTLVVAISLTAGQYQFSALSFMVPLAYTIFFGITEIFSGEVKQGVVGVSLTILALIIAVGLTAVQTLPFVELVRYSVRSKGFTLDQATQFAFHITDLATFLMPHFSTEISALLGQTGEAAAHYNHLQYFGVLPFLFAILALAAPRPKDRGLICLLGSAAVAAQLAAFGAALPVYRLVYLIFPFVRVPGRWMLIWTEAGVILAALGFDSLLDRLASENRDRVMRRLQKFGVIVGILAPVCVVIALIPGVLLPRLSLFLLAITLLMLASCFWMLPKLPLDQWSWAAVGPILLDLFFFAWVLSTPTSSRYFYDLQATLARLAVPPETYRLETSGRDSASALVPATDIGDPLRLDRIDHLLALGRRGINLMSGAYFISNGSSPELDLVEIRRNGESILYADPDVLPRLYAAPALKIVATESDALTAVASPSFDPFALAILVKDSDVPNLPRTSSGHAMFSGEITKYGMNQLSAQINVDRPAMIVFVETAYPGWEATVDGVPSRVWTVNYAFRGVVVEAGQHTITLTYRSLPFEMGMRVSIATAILFALGMAVWILIDKRRSNPTRKLSRYPADVLSSPEI